MKRRLVFAIAGVAAVAVILFGIPLAVFVERTYRDEELLRLQRDTVAATRSIDPFAGPADHPELPRFNGKIGFYSLHGALVAGTGPLQPDAIVLRAIRTRAPAGTAAAGELVVAVPLFRGELISGAVRGQRTDQAVATRTHRVWLELAALAAAVVALTVLAALALGSRLARPLESLAAVARRVGHGDFATRAQRSHVPEIDAVSEALNASSERIGELVAREREFSANASHQLRTPLAALRLELEVALLSGDSGEDQRAALSAALEQAERLETTIDTLLAHARARGEPHGSVDLRRAVSELEERWHGRLAAAGRPLRVDVTARHPIAQMSPAVLDEVAEILVQNAFEHGAGRVDVSIREAGGKLALEVSDQGDGFTADPETAFARGAGSGSGEGIGLALARSLAHAEGAMLSVTRAGPQPTLTLLLSASAEPETDPEPEPEPGSPQR
ncbi:MAG: sensor histidine kinase [Solirubrobacteraceae bacterium]